MESKKKKKIETIIIMSHSQEVNSRNSEHLIQFCLKIRFSLDFSENIEQNSIYHSEFLDFHSGTNVFDFEISSFPNLCKNIQ